MKNEEALFGHGSGSAWSGQVVRGSHGFSHSLRLVQFSILQIGMMQAI